MKKIFIALLIVLFTCDATAQTAPLYHFTDELKNAAKDCTPYEEDFSATNPILKTITKFFGLDDIVTFIRIKGENDKGFCDFSIFITASFIGEILSNKACKTSLSISPQLILISFVLAT